MGVKILDEPVIPKNCWVIPASPPPFEEVKVGFHALYLFHMTPSLLLPDYDWMALTFCLSMMEGILDVLPAGN